jgi:hypothetical protein
LTRTDSETVIRRIGANEINDNWQKIVRYLCKYKEKWKGYLRSMRMKQAKIVGAIKTRGTGYSL